MADAVHHQLQSLGLLTSITGAENWHKPTLERGTDSLWKEFFREPSKWLDSRASKRSPVQPDFTHITTKEPLWLDGGNNPSWVKDELRRCGYAVEHCHARAVPADAFLPSLWACSKNKDLSKGTRIHNELHTRGLAEKEYADALVTMYAKCGQLQRAQALMDTHGSTSVIAWTALISSYAHKGLGHKALSCFEEMNCKAVLPNVVTYVCTLKACSVIRAIQKGKEVHMEVLRQGLLEHNIVLGGALVDMYAKCGALPEAQSVLKTIPSRNVILWNALIAGFVQEEKNYEALECLEQMQREGIRPDAVTYVSILKACVDIRALERGMKIHDEVLRHGWLEDNMELGGALVDMYAKCGALPQAHNVLKKLTPRNTISWSALIAGYAQECQIEQAFKCFDEMQCEGILPDKVTFLCLLNLCSHLSLVEKGQELFDDMEAKYGLKPDVDCFTCMVGLLGRAGHLIKAVEMIQQMPFPANSAIWHSVLGACQKWVDFNIGTWVFEQAVLLDKCDEVAYVSMVNIYAAAGRPDKVKEIEAMRIHNKA